MIIMTAVPIARGQPFFMSMLSALIDRNKFQVITDIFGGRTHDLSVIQLVFQIVCDPSGDTSCRKQRREQLFRNAQHAVGQAGIQVDIGGDHCALALKHDFLDRVLKKFIEGEFVHAALLFGKRAAEFAQDLGAGIGERVDRVPESVNESGVIIILTV